MSFQRFFDWMMTFAILISFLVMLSLLDKPMG